MRTSLPAAVTAAMSLALVAGATPALAQSQAEETNTASLSVLHAVPDTPVDVYVNGALTLDDFAPGQLAGPLELPAGNIQVVITASDGNERRGMTVVFVAHADIETMRLPDQDDYQRWSLRLPQKSLPVFVDYCDIVGFIRQVSVVKGGEGERKRALSSEDRELIIHSGAAQISKNRYGITEALDVPEGGNPLLGLIPGLPGAATTKPARGKPAAPVADETETENKDENDG